MKGIVWAVTIEKANEKLEEIIEEYAKIRINSVKRVVNLSTHISTVTFDNGDYWQAVQATEQGKGQRCNISYIDRQLEKYVTTIKIIKQCTTAMPYNAINYF